MKAYFKQTRLYVQMLTLAFFISGNLIAQKPNILVIFGDDIGTTNVSAYRPFTKLRLQEIFNLYQDPYERADITSNTYWDWIMNHVGAVYGSMEDVAKFAAIFKEYPPRSIPPSFSAYTILEDVLDGIKMEAELKRIEAMKTTEPAPAKKKKQ